MGACVLGRPLYGFQNNTTWTAPSPVDHHPQIEQDCGRIGDNAAADTVEDPPLVETEGPLREEKSTESGDEVDADAASSAQVVTPEKATDCESAEEGSGQASTPQNDVKPHAEACQPSDYPESVTTPATRRSSTQRRSPTRSSRAFPTLQRRAPRRRADCGD